MKHLLKIPALSLEFVAGPTAVLLAYIGGVICKGATRLGLLADTSHATRKGL